jgi:hypothetical protein
MFCVRPITQAMCQLDRTPKMRQIPTSKFLKNNELQIMQEFPAPVQVANPYLFFLKSLIRQAWVV